MLYNFMSHILVSFPGHERKKSGLVSIVVYNNVCQNYPKPWQSDTVVFLPLVYYIDRIICSLIYMYLHAHVYMVQVHIQNTEFYTGIHSIFCNLSLYIPGVCLLK